MKYGIVYYKDTDNIGDDIQNYAVMQFLPGVDYMIDRERMSDFESEQGETVAVVLNGWFLHNKFNWPPAKEIYPLCISMHFTPNDYIDIGYDFLDGVGGAYLKNYAPVGCRDLNTHRILNEKGIECYLSGCVTLTLPQRKRIAEEKKYICLVDLPESVERRISEIVGKTGGELRKTTHWVNYKEQPVSWNERINKVEELLDIYQNASCVVTKRLHCALPCLAMGTPVLLILDAEKDDTTRYSHFTELLHVASSKEFLEGKLSYDILNPPANKSSFLKERKRIIQQIESFICGADEKNEAFLTWKSFPDYKIRKWREHMLCSAAEYASGEIDRLNREMNSLKVKMYDDTVALGKQYEQTVNEMNCEIARIGAEKERLDGVIEEKAVEEERLNNVIEEKAVEEERLNNVIEEKAVEEERLNNVIKEKILEEERLNNVIGEKSNLIHQYNGAAHELADCRDLLERSSVIWLLFFSRNFQKSTLKRKIYMLFMTLKCRAGKRDLSLIIERLENIY